jgi:hypothetical protein
LFCPFSSFPSLLCPVPLPPPCHFLLSSSSCRSSLVSTLFVLASGLSFRPGGRARAVSKWERKTDQNHKPRHLSWFMVCYSPAGPPT